MYRAPVEEVDVKDGVYITDANNKGTRLDKFNISG
jgi:hypothetical protein